MRFFILFLLPAILGASEFLIVPSDETGLRTGFTIIQETGSKHIETGSVLRDMLICKTDPLSLYGIDATSGKIVSWREDTGLISVMQSHGGGFIQLTRVGDFLAARSEGHIFRLSMQGPPIMQQMDEIHGACIGMVSVPKTEDLLVFYRTKNVTTVRVIPFGYDRKESIFDVAVDSRYEILPPMYACVAGGVLVRGRARTNGKADGLYSWMKVELLANEVRVSSDISGDVAVYNFCSSNHIADIRIKAPKGQAGLNGDRPP